MLPPDHNYTVLPNTCEIDDHVLFNAPNHNCIIHPIMDDVKKMHQLILLSLFK